MKERFEVEITLKSLIQAMVNRADEERDISAPERTHLRVYLCDSILIDQRGD